MEKKKLELADLPINMLSYIFQFLPTKKIFEVSSVSKRFYKAFFQDYIWESIVKQEELFLPEENKNFSGWKTYFKYLKELKKNLKGDSKVKYYKMYPYRGHKSVINAIEYILLDNAYDFIIVSGDEEGKVFTWNLEMDEDDDLVQTKDLIVDTKSKILGIKKYDNYKQLLIWNEDLNFYLYNYDYSVNISIKKNSERFKEIYKYNILEKDNYSFVSYNPEEQCVYLCKNFNNVLVAKTNKNEIIKINFSKNEKTSYKISMEYNQIFKIRESNLEENKNNYNSLMFLDKEVNIPFIENENFIIVYLNIDFIKGNYLYLYNKENDDDSIKFYNIRMIKKETKNEYRTYIKFDIIFSMNKIENNNNQIGILGQFNNKLYYRIYTPLNINLKLVNEYLIDNNQNILNIINIKLDILNISSNSLCYLINSKDLNTYNFETKQKKQIQLNNNKDVKCFFGDKYRIVLGFDDNLISIFNKETGNLYFNLIGGSLTVIPKSFVAKPGYTGFHLLKVTRTAIIGVLGNLIRVYSFKPQQK